MKIFTKSANENSEFFTNYIFDNIYEANQNNVLINECFNEYLFKLINSSLKKE